MKKTFFCLILIVSIIFTSVSASAYTPTSFDITAESAIMVSLDTGEVVFSKDADVRRYPASLTKIMTALIMLEHIENLDSEIITVTDYDVNSLLGTDSSIGGLKIGEQLTARQMLYYLLMISANDGALAIAEHVGGSIENFVEMMNAKAKELGMNGTHYVNPHGLHDDNHYTTCYDMQLLTKEALKYDAFVEVVKTTRYKMPATNLSKEKLFVTTNMLQDPATAYYYKYAQGVKTGYTDHAGRCLVSTAKCDGYSYLLVLMKCPVVVNGKRVRYEFSESKKLYEWIFDNFEYKSIYDSTSILGEASVDLSFESDHVSVVPKVSLSSILPKKADLSTVKVQLKLSKEKFNAPIKKGDDLGVAEISYAGETIGTIEVVAGDSVNGSFVLLIFHYIVLGLKSTAFKFILGFLALVVFIFIMYTVIINRNRKKRRRTRYK